MTKISWTKETWNPVTGCSKISAGCKNCYAERISHRWGWTTKPWTHENAKENIVLHPERLEDPCHWHKPRFVFVDSMFDLFHPVIPDDFIAKVFGVMSDLPRHTFQILTKRPERAANWPGPWTDNIWVGTSVENKQVLQRMEPIRECEATIRFVSFEPLLESLGRVNLEGMQWVIVGGESGPNHRAMDHAWAREIRDQCVSAGVPFFFKQDSDVKPEQRPWLVEKDGSRTKWKQYPDVASVQGQLSLF